MAHSAPVANATIYRFGTSGYRHNEEGAFNETVVRQITHAIADELIDRMHASGVVKPLIIGGDSRQKTAMALPIIRQVLAERGLDVLEADGVVATPVLAFAAAYPQEVVPDVKAVAGAILMTASHNPWDYGGYNFLTPEGAVAPSSLTRKFEQWQAQPSLRKLDRARFQLPAEPRHRIFNPYQAYRRHLLERLKLKLDGIAPAGVKIGYDPLYATGATVFPQLLRDSGIDAHVIHGESVRPDSYLGMPEPSAENLVELSQWVTETAQTNPLTLGLSNDGDSDRFGVLDEQGHYIQPNTVLALVMYHLITHHKMTGWLVRSQATSHWLDAFGALHGVEVCQTPVGYKYIAEEFLERSVLLGGESSGGLSIGGHIPEKDGLLANLLMAELVSLEKRPLTEIIAHVEATVPRAYRFRELTIHTERKDEIIAYFQQFFVNGGEVLPGVSVDRAATKASADALQATYGTHDGIKLYLADQAGWMLVRGSGTEPLVRFYYEVEAPTVAEAEAIRQHWQDWAVGLLRDSFGVTAADFKVKA